ALIGSILANSLLVLGLAFFAGGLRNGVQRFDSPRARTIATLTLLGAAILSVPTFAHVLHTPAAAHEQTLSLICGGVLLVVFVSTLSIFIAAGSAGADSCGPLRESLLRYESDARLSDAARRLSASGGRRHRSGRLRRREHLARGRRPRRALRRDRLGVLVGLGLELVGEQR